jgi:phosphoenolpyruvate synthase/pyruvate phosphate dikinase
MVSHKNYIMDKAQKFKKELKNLFSAQLLAVLATHQSGQPYTRKKAYQSIFHGAPIVIRSSAPAEDAQGSSFAGIHESYVNISGDDSVIEHIKLVWASLWSDAALLYRQELCLDVTKSSMAVILQEIIEGDRSGVAFTENPLQAGQGVIEFVYGLNQGLVDGTVQPDRWFIDRNTRKTISHVAANRGFYMVPKTGGIKMEPLPEPQTGQPPLNSQEIHDVFETAVKSEALFKKPQDMEWTYRDNLLFILQSRPITAVSGKNDQAEDDKRLWYMSLRRSLENLKILRNKIEDILIPGMIKEGEELKRTDIKAFSDTVLADEIEKRIGIHRKWEDVYWADFIPFAHGARFFGQVYNEMAKHPIRRQAKDAKNRNSLQKTFMDCFEGKERQNAEELLDLARTSYRLRDDDNIYLGLIDKEMERTLIEARKRLKKIGTTDLDVMDPADIAECLKDKTHVPDKKATATSISHKFTVQARQHIGQPAVHGIASGKARVITDRSVLRYFKSGEVLVCDAIDPNMTFVVPLAAAIVERRGGMLIHGAIIAREYGIACVTGVPDATGQIQTGDFVTVDGFLGIVTINRQ